MSEESIVHLPGDQLPSISPATPSKLYGRATDIQKLRGIVEGIVIVSGDAGIGKSALLDHLVNIADPEEVISPPLIRVRHSADGLRDSLLEALQHAVEKIVDEEGDVRTIASHLTDAAKRLAKDKVSELPKVVGRILLGIIRDRVGTEAADVVAEYIADVRTSCEEGLSARLAVEADTDVFKVLIDFIAEVQECAKKSIVLSLDGAERLSGQELALLADLCEALPPHVVIRVGFSTTDVESHDKVDRLVVAGASEVRLESLNLNEIGEWLESRGLNPKRTGEFMRLTDGYPLYIQDIVTAIERGADISDIEPSHRLGTLTKMSWRTLDLEAATVVGKLSAFADPPPIDRLLDLLRLNIHAWAELVRRLSEARIFCAKVNGRVWFHELRRQYIWDSVLSTDERSEAARFGVEELLGEFETEKNFSLLSTIARLVGESRHYASDPDVAQALALRGTALAIAASLIELTESSSIVPVLATDAVLNYARSVFNAPGDLLSGLRCLENWGLIQYADEPATRILLPQWSTSLVPLVIAGRSAEELGRVPVSGAATMIFQDELAPRLGPFTRVMYGMGRAKIAELAKLVPPRTSQIGERPAVYPGTHQPSIAIRGVFGGAPAFACVTYDEDVARDTVLPAVQSLEADLGGINFSTIDTITIPYSAIASRRFLNAAELVLGKSLTGMSRVEITESLPFEVALARKAETIRYVRLVSSKMERIAYGVDEPIGYVYWKGETESLYLTVAGGRERADPMQGDVVLPADQAYMFSELAQRASLMPSEHVDRIRHVLSADSMRNDPVIETLTELYQTAYQFNKVGERHEVVVSADSLKEQALVALNRRREDARNIAQIMGIPPGQLQSLSPCKYFLVVLSLKPGTRLFPANASYWLARCWWKALEGGQTDEMEVYVSRAFEEATEESLNNICRKAFLIEPGTMSHFGLLGDHTIASLLGFEAGHITLRVADDI